MKNTHSHSPCESLHAEYLEQVENFPEPTADYLELFHNDKLWCPQEMMDDFLDIRKKAEQMEEGIEYKNYCAIMWDTFFGMYDRTVEPYQSIYNTMHVNLVQGHYMIDVRSMVYDFLKQEEGVAAAETLGGRLYRDVLTMARKVYLWTMGDRHDSKYQLVKIIRAKILEDFQHMHSEFFSFGTSKMKKNSSVKLLDVMRDQMTQKLGVIIDPFKKKELEKIVLAEMTRFLDLWMGNEDTKNYTIGKDFHEHPPFHTVITVIDDRPENLDAVADLILRANTVLRNHTGYNGVGEPFAQFTYNPIWVAYSKKGQALRNHNLSYFQGLRHKYLVIEDPKDFYKGKNLEAFRHALVFCDVDGVLIDNVEQGKWQSKAPYIALLCAREQIKALNAA